MTFVLKVYFVSR